MIGVDVVCDDILPPCPHDAGVKEEMIEILDRRSKRMKFIVNDFSKRFSALKVRLIYGSDI